MTNAAILDDPHRAGDAVVVFGMTGDLAIVMTFLSLRATPVNRMRGLSR